MLRRYLFHFAYITPIFLKFLHVGEVTNKIQRSVERALKWKIGSLVNPIPFPLCHSLAVSL